VVGRTFGEHIAGHNDEVLLEIRRSHEERHHIPNETLSMIANAVMDAPIKVAYIDATKNGIPEEILDMHLKGKHFKKILERFWPNSRSTEPGGKFQSHLIFIPEGVAGFVRYDGENRNPGAVMQFLHDQLAAGSNGDASFMSHIEEAVEDMAEVDEKRKKEGAQKKAKERAEREKEEQDREKDEV